MIFLLISHIAEYCTFLKSFGRSYLDRCGTISTICTIVQYATVKEGFFHSWERGCQCPQGKVLCQEFEQGSSLISLPRNSPGQRPGFPLVKNKLALVLNTLQVQALISLLYHVIAATRPSSRSYFVNIPPIQRKVCNTFVILLL